MGDREKAFVVMQVGREGSPERQRADEFYEFVITPALKHVGLMPYRADLDATPGAITQKMLEELINSRLVIADLTGNNPNVFYELGITHSFAKPLISIADSASSLPFDAKDERIIELGSYDHDARLSYAQGERVKENLISSLKIVMREGYEPPSPLRELAGRRSIGDLAPDDPVASELTQIRQMLEEVKKSGALTHQKIPTYVRADIRVMRWFIERNAAQVGPEEIESLIGQDTSDQHDVWVRRIMDSIKETRASPVD